MNINEKPLKYGNLVRFYQNLKNNDLKNLSIKGYKHDDESGDIFIGNDIDENVAAVNISANYGMYVYGLGEYDGTNQSSANTLQEVIENFENEIFDTLDEKQDTLFAGENISIDSGNTISAVDTTYNAGTGISIDSGNTISVVDMMPIGSIIMWATNTPPNGWLICSGQSISGDEYTELRSVLGTNVVPDMRGRFPLGVNTTYTLGATGGTEEETLTVNQIPSHNHEIKSLYHETGTLSSTYRTFNLNSMSSQPSTLETLNPTDFTENTGGSNAHNNMPPYLSLNFIIKYTTATTNN